MNKTYTIIILSIIILILLAGIGLYATTYPLKSSDLTYQKGKTKEKHFVQAYCKGEIEVRLPDKTRVDCLTDEYAIEFDYANKWAESIGQSLYYAKMTGKKPAVAIIMKKPTEERYIKRIEKANSDITIFKIQGYKNSSL